MSGYRYVGGTYVNKKLDIRLERGDRLTEEEVRQLPKNIRERCREDDLSTASQGVEELREQLYKLQDTVATLAEEKQSTDEKNAELKAKVAELEENTNGEVSEDGEESQVDDESDGETDGDQEFPIKKNGGWWEFSDGEKKQCSPEEAHEYEANIKKKE